MDLRALYRKIRQEEERIAEPHVIVVSEQTPDGGKAGVKTEVTRSAAARLIVEGRAKLATPEEAAEYFAELAGAAD